MKLGQELNEDKKKINSLGTENQDFKQQMEDRSESDNRAEFSRIQEDKQLLAEK